MKFRWKIAQAAEWRWWKHYLRDKEPGEYLARKRAYWYRVLDHAGIRVAPGEQVLDAGCGPAGIFMVLEQADVVAVDPLLERYEQVIPHFSKEAYPGVRFRQQAVELLDERDTYDWVFCLNVINHVATLQRALQRLCQALKPGKTLVLSIDAHNFTFLKHIFRFLPGDILHPHQHGLEDYQLMLIEAGIQIEKTIRLKKGGIFDYYLIVGRRGE